jgi:2-polyprenyl-3-methyl-5-hydroxy-6-metoxy-1,4-benzoquinol methylase
MSIIMDAPGRETQMLFLTAGSLEGLRVLEIGCGDGRLTRRYAEAAAHVTAIDPNAEKIARAQAELPEALHERINYQAIDLQSFAAQGRGPAGSGRFDMALLSWSL